MRRRIEAALADCQKRIEAGEATFEEALGLYPELRAELEPLLELAMELRVLPKLTAPASLRGYKRPVFRSRPAPVSPLASWWSGVRNLLTPSPAWVAGIARAAGVLAGLLLVSGTTLVASANTLPDELLYPVKLAAEDAQLAVTADPKAKVDLELLLASRRLEEVDRAAREGRSEAVARGLALYEEKVQGAKKSAQVAGPEVSEADVDEQVAQNQEALSAVLTKFQERDQNPQAIAAIEHAMEVSSKLEAARGKSEAEPKGKALGHEQAPPPTATAGPTATPEAPTKGKSGNVEAPGKPEGAGQGAPGKPEGAGEKAASGQGQGQGQGRGNQAPAPTATPGSTSPAATATAVARAGPEPKGKAGSPPGQSNTQRSSRSKDLVGSLLDTLGDLVKGGPKK